MFRNQCHKSDTFHDCLCNRLFSKEVIKEGIYKSIFYTDCLYSLLSESLPTLRGDPYASDEDETYQPSDESEESTDSDDVE